VTAPACYRADDSGVTRFVRVTPNAGRDAIEGVETRDDGGCVLRLRRQGVPPWPAAGWVAEDGETRVAPVVRAALRPSNWLGLWMLARRYRAARESLVRAAKRLAADDFLFT